MLQANPSPLPSAAQQLETWQIIKQPNLAAGQKWYMVDIYFYREFMGHINDGDAPPSRISNDRLVMKSANGVPSLEEHAKFAAACAARDMDPIPRPGLMENKDLVLLCQEQWDYLASIYRGGPALECLCVSARRGLIIEMYPLLLWLDWREGQECVPSVASRSETCESLLERIKIQSMSTSVSTTVEDGVIGMVLISPSGHERHKITGSSAELETSLEEFDSLCDFWECRVIKEGHVDDDDEEEASSFPSMLPRVTSMDDSVGENPWSYPSGPPPFEPPGLPTNSPGSFQNPAIQQVFAVGEEEGASSSSTGVSGFYRSSSNNYNGSSSSSYPPALIKVVSPPAVAQGHGLKGLQNLGNTCFMNSALQCLSNSECLTRYFIGEGWKGDLNRGNILGMQGELAGEYAKVVQELWSNDGSFYVIPNEFKRVIARFAPQFTGFQQHDSQELLAFLLDGLHEDLNRVRVKPPTEVPQGNGQDDDEIAALTWERWMLRNDSYIQDLFWGQYKSRLECPDPECGRVSVTFDSYSHITLELPQESTVSLEVTIRFADSSLRPQRMLIKVIKTGGVSEIKRAIAEVADIDEDMLAIGEIEKDWQGRSITDMALLKKGAKVSWLPSRRGSELYAYELESRPRDPLEPRAITYGSSFSTWTTPSFTSPAFAPKSFATAHPVDAGTENEGEQGGESTGQQESRTIFVKVEPRKAKTTLYGSDGEMVATPFLAALPLGCSYGKLRNVLEVAMSRYLHAAPQGESDCSMEFVDAEGHVSGSRSWSEKVFSISIKTTSYDSFEVVDDSGTQRIAHMDTLHLSFPEDGLLSLDSEEEKKVEVHPSARIEAQGEGSDAGKGVITLYQCLDSFTKKEILDEKDAWYCPSCKCFQRASKEMGLWTAPDNLIIHLKRFSQQEGAFSLFSSDKVESLVTFPFEGLDMSPYVISRAHEGQEMIYDLRGVINHFGGSGFGHYTAYCHSPGDNQWHLFDDSNVTRASLEDVCGPAAYVLFYRKRV